MTHPFDAARRHGAPRMRRRFIGGVAIAMILAVLVYGALVVLTDARAVAERLATFPVGPLIGLVGIGTAGILARALRWRWLMARLGHPSTAADSIYVHVPSQATSVTPGRIGEVLKPWLSREIAGLPLASGFGLVFAERVADLLGVVLLSFGAVSLLVGGIWTAVLAALAFAIVILVLGAHRLQELALRVLARSKTLRRHSVSAERIAGAFTAALHPRLLGPSVLVSCAVWGLEGLGLAWCTRLLGFDQLTVYATVSLYALSILAGALSFMPGGLGLTEASMTGALIAAGMPNADASTATLIMRAATLWWGVALGWMVIASRPRLLARLLAGGGEGTTDESTDGAPGEAEESVTPSSPPVG